MKMMINMRSSMIRSGARKIRGGIKKRKRKILRRGLRSLQIIYSNMKRSIKRRMIFSTICSAGEGVKINSRMVLNLNFF